MINRIKGKIPSHVSIIQHEKCKGKAHLEEYFQNAITSGCEGVILRKEMSFYFDSHSWFKKIVRLDMR